MDREQARMVLKEYSMSDYDRIAQAISFIASHANEQPSLDEIAAQVNLSPYHFQRMFCRWTGTTPKRFLQVLTVERAKQLLLESGSLLEVSDAVGLSSGSRLHDHFVQLEAVTPGEFRKRGEGMDIEYGVHATPFGDAFIGVTGRGICALEFADGGQSGQGLQRLSDTWPQARLSENVRATGQVVESIFDEPAQINRPLSLYVHGTNFQVNVWKALLRIPPGRVVSYSQIATAIGRPRAARAVGMAVGDNPIAFLIPCHRVIQQNGGLGGYHWGETRKQAIHTWEAARHE